MATSLPVRKCGSLGFECAAQGLGCMSMSAEYLGFETDEAQEEALRVLGKAAELPDFMLDTSDLYGPHTNEQLIQKGIANKRGTLKIATKCGITLIDKQIGFNSTPEHIKECCKGSLERLGVDCIDLYFLHRYDLKTPIEETMGAFKDLIEEGKIKYVGVSEMPVATLRKAHAICPITAYQLEWSLFARDVEDELVPTCRELGIGIVAYSPLGRGLLTGEIKGKEDLLKGDVRNILPRMSEFLEENLKLVEVVKEVAKERGCTPGQVAIAWVHAQGDDVFPIPGTKRVSRFEENLAAFDIKLTDEEMTKLNELADKVKGLRYPAAWMFTTFGGGILPETAPKTPEHLL